jgi:hypothetical protein
MSNPRTYRRDAPDGPMTGNPGGPINLAETHSDRSHGHGRRQRPDRMRKL